MKCLNCSVKMFKHDSEELSDNDECDEIECIAESSHNDETWYLCERCNYFYLECPNCKIFCNIIMHPFYNSNGEKVEEADINIPYIDISKWCATGPDGGMYHTWSCESCDFLKSYSDK